MYWGTKEAWFAGLIDGEGCFTLSISVQHKHSLHISPRFIISMKQGQWAKEVSVILVSHQIPFHIRKRRNQLELTVSSGLAVQRLIRFVIPYLVVKKPLAARLRSFPKAPNRNRYTWVSGSYIEAVAELIDFVRQFNKGRNRRHRWDGKRVRDFFKE